MERVIVAKKKPGIDLEIEIFPEKNKQKMTMLFAWLIAWTAGGLIIASQLFADHDKNVKMFLVIWIAFFIYFEFKVLYVLRWRKHGSEKIVIAEGKLKLLSKIKERGLEHVYDIDKIEDLSYTLTNKNSYKNVLGDSFWVVGNEGIQFTYEGRKVAFGYQLNERLTEKVIRLVGQELTRQQKKISY